MTTFPGSPRILKGAIVAYTLPALVPRVGTGVAAVDLAMPAVMFFCYLLWTRADFLLLARA